MIRFARPSGARWRMRTTPAPCSAARLSRSATLSAFSSSSPASTSSASSTRGFVRIVRARLTRAACPPDRSRGLRSSWMSAQPIASSNWRICSSASISAGSCLRSPCRTASVHGRRITSATVSPMSVEVCGRYDTRTRHCCGVNESESLPSSANVPVVCALRRAKAVSSVDLPAPEGPVMSTTSPVSTWKLRSWKTVWSPPCWGMTAVTWVASNKCGAGGVGFGLIPATVQTGGACRAVLRPRRGMEKRRVCIW